MGNEFGVAVKVFPYPNYVFAVWVYVAEMKKKDDG